MTEADFQSIFTKWAKTNLDRSAAFELKICKQKSMPFSRVEEHQLVALHRAKHYTLFHKISDMSLGYKPFDCFMLAESEAFIVVMFYVPNKRRYCYMIDIDTWMNHTAKSKRKSLTEEDARKIGMVIDLSE